jgi:hypothetical protein
LTRGLTKFIAKSKRKENGKKLKDARRRRIEQRMRERREWKAKYGLK